MSMNLKHTLSVFIFALALAGCTARQEFKQYADYSAGSGFSVSASGGEIDSAMVENLEVLGRVWGFAKYHHPVFATQKLNADYELFELLPRVAYARKEERNAVLVEWVRGLGEFKSAEDKYLADITENGYTTPIDWSWLEDKETLGVDLAETLQRLRWAKHPKPSRYAFYNEKTFLFDMNAESVAAPFSNDAGYNLLTMFRLWNMAQYYFPSVNITNKNWNDVLKEYIPNFLAVKSTYNAQWTTTELIAELSDSHSVMISGNPIYSENWLPVEFGFVEGKLIVTDNRKFLAAGENPVFESGDEIISIDGHAPDYFIEHSRKYIAASNESTLLRDAAVLASNASGRKIPIAIKRNGQRIDFDIATFPRDEYYNRLDEWTNSKTYYELLNDSVGYLYAGRFNRSNGAEIMAKFANTNAMIVDMRCYPSDVLIFDFIGRYLIPHKTQHVIWLTHVAELPGYYMEDPESLGDTNDDYYKGLVVVLVNSETQSQAEYTTMSFQATPNCIVVGSQTAGADGNIVELPLPRGIKTWFSGLGVYYPDGTNTQRAGVKIDYYVEPTIEGVKAGRDEILEKALEIIETK